MARAQEELVYSLVIQQPHRDLLFEGFRPFTGVFAVEPWKPDARQSAQQGLFLCVANIGLSFMDNLAAHKPEEEPTVYRFVMPTALRDEVLGRLKTMNITAATLFPDLMGLARSMRRPHVHLDRTSAAPPWRSSSE